MLCRIGDVEIWRILEINAPYLPAKDLFPDVPNVAPTCTQTMSAGTPNSRMAAGCQPSQTPVT